MEADRIINIMERLEGSNYQKILIDGPWGIGKTEYILDYQDDKENVFYISLFGKKSMESILHDLSYLILSRTKKVVGKIKDAIDLDFSLYGLNISMPVINDLYKNIINEFKEKSVTLILDDLERMHENLDIREVFGFVENITTENDVKVIFVASTDHLSKEVAEKFYSYSEKSIDRKYIITSYASEAPQNILGEDIWKDIQGIYENNRSNNLRTLIKASSFIEEVIQDIPSECFSSKFNKPDLLKICFAAVLLVVEHTEYTKTNEDDENEKQPKEDEVSQKQISYIWHNIIRRNTITNEMYNIVEIILDWYKIGDYSREQLMLAIDHINQYKETLPPVFMAEEHIKKELKSLTEFEFYKSTKNKSIREIIHRIDELARITEKVEMDFSYNTREIIDWIKEIIKSDEESEERLIYSGMLSNYESAFVNELTCQLKAELKSDKKQRMKSGLELNVGKKSNEINSEDEKITIEFNRTIEVEKDNEIKEELLSHMRECSFYLPLPTGEITDLHWSYCHQIFKIIKKIKEDWKDKKFVEEAIEFFEKKVAESTDLMLQYRLNFLIDYFLK